MPDPENNGKRYLRIPLDALEGATWDERDSAAFVPSRVGGIRVHSVLGVTAGHR